MAIKKEIDINVNTKSAEDSVDNLSSGLSGVAAQADKLTGGLVSGFRNGVKGIKNAVKGFKSLKVAIAATGIGVISYCFRFISFILSLRLREGLISYLRQ